MMDFVNFLVEYWQYISAGILIILNILLFIFRRKPKSWNEFLDALSKLLFWVPEAIKVAETSFDENQPTSKKDCALEYLLDMIENRLKRELTAKEVSCFYSLMSEQIETILSCPTKKGGIGREEDE